MRAVLVLTVLGVAAVVAARWPDPVDASDSAMTAAAITGDGLGLYVISEREGTVVATAAESNSGGNTRVVFWRSDDPPTTDHESCSTWVGNETNSQQQGAALRVRSESGRTRAITVTKNVYANYFWEFNVHLMDSGAKKPYQQIGSFSLAGAFFDPNGTGRLVPYPWRMCAQTSGRTVSFKAWPLAGGEPGWGDSGYGGRVELPAGQGWEQPGHAGWYVGHLRPGESVGFSDITTGEI